MTLSGDRLRNPRAEMGLRPSSARRSVRLDVSWPHSLAGDQSSEMLVDSYATDTCVDPSGAGHTVAHATLHVTLAPGHRVTALESSPDIPDQDILIGRRASSGWRGTVHSLLPDGGPLLQLLDDLPVAVLISGYAGLRTGALDAMEGDSRTITGMRMLDICAGWSSESVALRTLQDADARPIVPDMADAPAWSQPDGEAVPIGVIRRERRIDVWRDGDALEVEATFRDSFGEQAELTPSGEGVLHEYALRARVDDGRLVSLEPEARVLPYPECPSAVRATQQLLGERVEDLAHLVPEVLVSTSSCTHLNDLLRSLSCVTALGDNVLLTS